MSERPGAVTFKGGPLTLVGDELAAGQAAPDFTLVTNDLEGKSLADFSGKVLVLVTVPSLDTPVCDVETRRFNEEAAALGNDVAVAAVSVDSRRSVGAVPLGSSGSRPCPTTRIVPSARRTA